jgi:N-acetylglutamate synthase-like GNAT family acetyltransferase
VPFTLRDATEGDLPKLQKVFRHASLSNEGDRAALMEHPEALVFALTPEIGARVRVATIEPDVIVGFATTIPAHGFLELVDLFTDPDWMRQGVATALIDDIAVFATTKNIGRLSVVGNLHALGFYRCVGFIADGPVPTELGQGLRMHMTFPR